MANMTRVAVLDDWQGVAQTSADWSRLMARADVVFFEQAFANEDDAAAKLADFDIVLSMRERTPLPGTLINRLPKLRMLGITGARNLSLDTPACTARGVVVCNTQGGGFADSATAELALGLLIAAARGSMVGDAAIRAPEGEAIVEGVHGRVGEFDFPGRAAVDGFVNLKIVGVVADREQVGDFVANAVDVAELQFVVGVGGGSRHDARSPGFSAVGGDHEGAACARSPHHVFVHGANCNQELSGSAHLRSNRRLLHLPAVVAS